VILALFALLALAPRIEIVSANDTTMTYRVRLPLQVALDPTTRMYHFKGCPDVRPGEEWVSPAAAQLRGFKAHSYVSLGEGPSSAASRHLLPMGEGCRRRRALSLGRGWREAPGEGGPLFVDAVTQSGASLEDLWIRTEALRRIWQEHWDYVILQERGGSAARDRGELFHRYLGMFAAEARKSGATPVLFMTWNAGSEDFFKSAARRANAWLLPVGLAWDDLLARGDFSRLDWDGKHPNVAGSYLIASSVYATIYDKVPRDLPFDFRHLAVPDEFYDKALLEQTLNEEQARMIQRAAWRALQRAKNP